MYGLVWFWGGSQTIGSLTAGCGGLGSGFGLLRREPNKRLSAKIFCNLFLN
jgi:hypothetical protein